MVLGSHFHSAFLLRFFQFSHDFATLWNLELLHHHSCEPLLSSARTRWCLYQLWNVKSPESSYTFENPYSTGEKGIRGFLSREIVLRFFFCCPFSLPDWPHPQTTLRAQRRKCVVKYLTWSIPSPPPAANPFLCWISPTRLSLFRPSFLSPHPLWLDS